MINKKFFSIVFVDEVDNLFEKQNNISEMLEIFKFAKMKSSNLIFIGVSNTIDLIIKLNEKYKLATNIQNIVFQPYKWNQIFEILITRLKKSISNEKINEIFDEFGLKYCAKKIQSIKGGDIRCVLDIIKKSFMVKLAEINLKKSFCKLNHNNITDIEDTEKAELKVTFEDISKVHSTHKNY